VHEEEKKMRMKFKIFSTW